MKAKSIYLLPLTCILLITLAVYGILRYDKMLDVVGGLFEPRNKTVMLVVAKHDYPAGTIITNPEQMFELREILEQDAPLDRCTDVGDVLRGWMLRDDIHEGEPLKNAIVVPPLPLFAALLEHLEPPGPGRQYLPITIAQAREESVRVGTRVDVIQSRSKDDPKGESKILLHDVLVRAVMPDALLQEMLNEDGRRNLVALKVLVETSAEEGQVFFASVKHYGFGEFFEVRPSADNKKVDKKNSPKVP
jgi:hypothetical protein